MPAVFVLLIGATFLANPSAPPEAELKTEVQRLLRQLDAEQLAERDAAEQALIEKGPAVFPLLPGPGQRISAEVQQRLARVRLKLQQAIVNSAVQPTRITLAAEKMPLSKILAAFQKQSGNKILDYRTQFGQPADDPPLTVKFEKTPFWEALDTVLDQAGLTLYPYADEPGLSLVARSAGQRPRRENVCYDGPFRFAVAQVLALRDFRAKEAAVLKVTLETTWEPRLKPIVLKQTLKDIQAEDERGEKIKLLRKEAEQEIPSGDETSGVELTLPFVLPPRKVQRIARLQGRLTALIPGHIETFRFGDLLKAKNQKQRGAGATAILEGVRENNDVWEVRIRIKFDDAGDALASHRGWILRNEAFLEDPDGKPIPYDGMETTLQARDEVGLAYLFVLEKPPAKLKFVYKTPGAILGKTFKYEFKNIPLP